MWRKSLSRSDLTGMNRKVRLYEYWDDTFAYLKKKNISHSQEKLIKAYIAKNSIFQANICENYITFWNNLFHQQSDYRYSFIQHTWSNILQFLAYAFPLRHHSDKVLLVQNKIKTKYVHKYIQNMNVHKYFWKIKSKLI